MGVEFKGPGDRSRSHGWSVHDSLAELAQLALTAGLDVVAQTSQRLDRPHAATYIGPGKAQEVGRQARTAAANVVIFDDELSPRHQRELERALGDNVKVVDRTGLILDIFAQHARTREGALQVELAQYAYRLPRLTRAWAHLARQAGGRAGGATGGVGVRGPGETQLETDRRAIGRRMAQLRRELERVRSHRSQYRRRRRRAGIPTAAIVGYTNAGKSTLLNALSDADVYVANKLFATLDPTTRRVALPSGRDALFTDTVGFIQKLPTELVAAFRATLEEVTEADLLLHVMDVTNPRVLQQARSVSQTLEEIGASDKPVVNALNKVDLMREQQHSIDLAGQFRNTVAISAREGTGLDALLTSVEKALEAALVPVDVVVPYGSGALVREFHRRGLVESIVHSEDGTHIIGRLPRELVGLFEPPTITE